MKTSLLLIASAAACLVSGSALAASAVCTTSPCDTNFTVTTEVIASCSSVSAGDLDFGSRPAINGFFDVATQIDVVCTTGTPYTVELDYGITPASASSTQRQVSDFATGQFIDYAIYQPSSGGAAATTTLWGLAADDLEFNGMGTGATQTLTATGRLDQNDSVGPGTYTDLVTVFLSY